MRLVAWLGGAMALWGGCRPAPVAPVPGGPALPDSTAPGPEPGVSDTGPPPTPPPDVGGWWQSAGAATIDALDEPFATIRSDLSLEALATASRGRELFVGDWRVGPSDPPSVLDGLGPLYHATSCLACHPAAGRAEAWMDGGGVGPGVLLRLLRRDTGGADPIYGAQLQPLGIEGIDGEAVLSWRLLAASGWQVWDGTVIERSRPSPILQLSQGPLHEATHAGPRLSPHLVGAALLGAVPEATLIQLEDPDDLDEDGISGRVARVEPMDPIGRFGWRAGQPSLRDQVTAAFAADMGITSPDRPHPVCTPTQLGCLELAGAGGPELSEEGLGDVLDYLAALGVPGRRLPASGDPGPGEALFAAVGCAECHLPTLITAPDAQPAHLAGVQLHPYTDLLLHDLGPGLAEPVGEGAAGASEWRTPPLWGLGLVAVQARARFLHDGRASTLEEAIVWHGGEAEASREAYAALDAADRSLLLEFLSLL